MSFKRPRTPSHSSSSSSSSSLGHTSKVFRTTPNPSSESATSTHRLLCTLPPTCNHHPTPIANIKDLEAHYATYHAHVCEEGGCGCVFPDARLLELHQTECHDPLAAVRKDRGEKIFACHLTSCARLFLTPKARRLHLIQAHGFPKEYFFAVTNKGVGGLLKRWGEGASMIRGGWKAREVGGEADNENTGRDGESRDGDMAVDEDNDEDTNTNNAGEQNKYQHQRQLQAKAMKPKPALVDESLDALTKSIDSLSLVPPSIRFGRGGKNGGFVNPHPNHDLDMSGRRMYPPHVARVVRGRGGLRGRGIDARGRGRSNGIGLGTGGIDVEGRAETIEVDVPQHSVQFQTQVPVFAGRGMGRGRGRAGIISVRGMGMGARGRGIGIRGRGGVRGRGPS